MENSKKDHRATAGKVLKKFLCFTLTVACLFVVSMPVMAEEIDPDRTGSISVNIQAYGTDDVVGGGSLHLYQIAGITVTETEGAEYHYTDSFSGCSEDLLTEDEIFKAKTAETFFEWVNGHEIAADETVSVDADGKACFTDLSCGLYLITQAEAAEGYNAINAFLVSVPLNEDGAWIYDVDATPKTSPVTKTENPEPKKETPEPEPTPTPTPDTGGNGGDGGDGGTNNGGSAKTGDNDYLPYGVLMIAAALVIGVVLHRRTHRTVQ